MDRKQLDVVGAAASFLLSFAAFAGMLFLLRETAPQTPLARALAIGAVFAVPALVGYIAVRAAAALRRDLTVQMPPVFSVAVVVMLLLSFAAGFAAQYAYSYDTYEVRETKKGHDSSDIVMMVDDSGSLVPYFEPLRNVANAFVDGVSDDCNLAAGLFARKIGDFVDMAVMDSAGKQAVKKMLEADNRFAGGSDLDLAIRTAYDCFTSQNSSKRPRAIVLLTDGQGEIDDDLIDMLKEEDIRLYTVRIAGSDGPGTSDLLTAVKSTGGADIEISDTFSADTDDLDKFMEQFEEIAGSVSSKTVKEFGERLLAYDEESPTLARILIRLAAVFAVVLCVQLLYLRRISVIAVLADFLSAVAVCAAMTFAPRLSSAATGVVLSAAAAAAGIYTWYVMLVQEGGYESLYRQLAKMTQGKAGPTASDPQPAYGTYGTAPGTQHPYTAAPNTQNPYGNAQNAQNPYGIAQNTQNPYGTAQNAQNPYGTAQNTQNPYGTVKNAPNPYGNARNAQNPYGTAQNTQNPYGTARNTQNPYGNAQNTQNPYGTARNTQNPYGTAPDTQNPYGNAQNTQNPYGNAQNAPDPYGAAPSAAARNNASPAAPPQGGTPWSNGQRPY